MKKPKITKRDKDWFIILMGITLLGYIFYLEYTMLIGVGCLIMCFVDFLADKTMLKSK